MAEVATGKMAAPVSTLANMVLSHATEEGASGSAGSSSEGVAAGAKSLVDNLKSMLNKPKAKAA
jgi:pilus assembly protein CpaE